VKTDAGWTWAPSLGLAALGFSCITTQLVLIRELLAAFSGNEIILGIVLGLWLLLMGAGSWLGRLADGISQRVLVFGRLQTLLALIPLLQVFLLRVLRDSLFTRGADVGISETVLSCGILLLPYCLPAGFALALGCTMLAQSRGVAGVGAGYALDSIGTIFGGLFFLVLVTLFDHLRVLVVPAALNLVSAGLLSVYSGRKLWAIIPAALTVAVVLLFWLLNLDAFTSRFQLPGQRILACANSPYGRLLVSESDGQINFIENGIALTSTRDDQHVEETVHYAMSQRPQAARVLLLSGGISGTGLEALRYGASRLDYLELDPSLLELGRKYVPQNLGDQRLHIVKADPRVYVKRTRALYDVIIVDLPSPSTLQLNRFYTVEFFTEAKRALTANGVLSFALGRYENYISPEMGRLLACARNTLQKVFTNTLVVPGGHVFFLASAAPLDPQIIARVEACGLKNRLVNRHYLEAMLAPDRVAEVTQASSAAARINYDLGPVLYFLHLRHWMSQFSFTAGLLPVLFVLGLAAYLLRLRGAALVLFASGFAGSSLELILLLGFQVLCGSVYHQVALIVTAFMFGLALGAVLSNRRGSLRLIGAAASAAERVRGSPAVARETSKPLASLSLALAVYSLALPFLLRAMCLLSASPAALLTVKIAICLLSGLLGTAIGAQFPLANRGQQGSPAHVVSQLFTADFLGAFVGAILAATVLLPVIGVFGVCLVTGALNALAALALSRLKA